MFEMRKSNAPVNGVPRWKYIMILILVVLGVIYSLPNIFGDSPALQITAKGGKAIPEATAIKIKQSLTDSKIPFV